MNRFLMSVEHTDTSHDEEQDEGREGVGCIHRPDVRIKVPKLRAGEQRGPNTGKM